MITNIFRAACFTLIVAGLIWIYNVFYGGPFDPVFAWLNQFLPSSIQLPLPSTPLKPVTGV